MDPKTTRVEAPHTARVAVVISAILIAVLLPRLQSSARPSPSLFTSHVSASGRHVPQRAPKAQQVIDGMSCDDNERWNGLKPQVADPSGDLEAVWITSDSPGDLLGSQRVYVRVDAKPGVPVHRLLIDADGDRMTGMWTAQSHLSDSGWDHMVDPAGVLYRHAAPRPNDWKWDSVKSKQLETVHAGDRYYFCIPLEDLPPTSQLFITAENNQIALPMRFVRGAAYPNSEVELRPEKVMAPKRMAFYYSGSPWIVRECTGWDQTQVDCAAKVFRKFRHVVFGARLEEASRGGHVGAANLMQRLRKTAPKTELWGYISFLGSQKDANGHRDVVYTLDEYIDRASRWKAMGATGIFLDEYDVCDPSWQSCRSGPDGKGVLLTRERQVQIVEAIHSMGLAVFANSHSVQNALGVIDGTSAPLGDGDGSRPADMYLLENPTVVYGKFHTGFDRAAHLARFAQAVRLTQETGTRLGVLDSMTGTVPDTASTWIEYRVGWWQAAQAGADAYAFFADNLPLLAPPSDASGLRGLTFDSGGIHFKDEGGTSERGVVDCQGQRVGAIRRTGETAGLVIENTKSAC